MSCALTHALFFKKDLDLSLIITENATFVLCCWNYVAEMSVHLMIEELKRVSACTAILEAIEVRSSVKCLRVTGFVLIRDDLPLLENVEYNPECGQLSKHVVVSRENAAAKCAWLPTHFDLGYNAFYPSTTYVEGYINAKICQRFHEDCQVKKFDVQIMTWLKKDKKKMQ